MPICDIVTIILNYRNFNHNKVYRPNRASRYRTNSIRSRSTTLAITHSFRLPIFANFLINQKRSALAQDPKLMEKSGKTFVGAQLALEYGVHDVDGKRPRPLSADDV